jgi:hypothetical protein
LPDKITVKVERPQRSEQPWPARPQVMACPGRTASDREAPSSTRLPHRARSGHTCPRCDLSARYASRMGALRRLGQDLGLVYRDDDAWRPTGWTPPTASTSQPGHKPPANPVAAGRPWWQTTKTADGGFVLGILSTIFGAAGLLVRPWALTWGWFKTAAAAWMLIVGLCHLVTAVALRRRERSGSRPDA